MAAGTRVTPEELTPEQVDEYWTRLAAMKKQFEKMSEADKEAIEHHLEHSPHHTVCFDWCDAKIAASPQARNLASSHLPSPDLAVTSP